MSALTPIEADHADLLEYEATQCLILERRFSVPGCPWQCDNGWRMVEDEDQTPRSLEVVVDGVLYTPCECNMLTATKVKRPFNST